MITYNFDELNLETCYLLSELGSWLTIDGDKKRVLLIDARPDILSSQNEKTLAKP